MGATMAKPPYTELIYVGDSPVSHEPASTEGWPVLTLCGLTGTRGILDHHDQGPTCSRCQSVQKGQSDER